MQVQKTFMQVRLKTFFACSENIYASTIENIYACSENIYTSSEHIINTVWITQRLN